jgi:hypothetical protein
MRALLAVVLLLFCSAAHAQQQNVWKHFLRPDLGLGIHVYSLAESDTTPQQDLNSRYNTVHLGGMVGLNLPFLPIADNFSAGLNPNVALTIALSGSGESQSMSIEAPVYATLKYGTDATWSGSKSIVGVTAGIGYQYTLFIFPATVVSYGLPSVMAEINFGKRRSDIGLIKFRYAVSLGNHIEPFTSGGTETQIVFTHHSFYLLFTPGY